MTTVEHAPRSLRRSWSLRLLLCLWMAFCKAARHNLFLCYGCWSFLSNALSDVSICHWVLNQRLNFPSITVSFFPAIVSVVALGVWKWLCEMYSYWPQNFLMSGTFYHYWFVFWWIWFFLRPTITMSNLLLSCYRHLWNAFI